MKTFLLDTNVLLHDPASLKVFINNEVVIPISVLDELDNAKIRVDEVGRNARHVIRMIDSLRSIGSLSEGVKLKESIIKVEINHQGNVPYGLSKEKIDNNILSTAIGIKNEGKHVIVVSKDINLRVKCDVLGVEAQDYVGDKIAPNTESIYSGTGELMVPSSKIDELYIDGQTIIGGIDAHANQFFCLKSDSKDNHCGIARYVGNDTFKVMKQMNEICNVYPRNVEQKMAMDLLLDPSIKLVTMTGLAGSGKTLCAIASAVHQTVGKEQFNRILISRPIQPMGRDIGFLPGDLTEKLRPWMQPIYDNLEFILGIDYESTDLYEGIIHVEPLTYIRGRSIPKSFFILDEAQNLSMHEIKTIITRVGEGTKIVITGDLAQIDAPYIDFADSGLTHVIEKFKDYPIAGHVTLKKGERSDLATIASNIL